MNQLKWSIVAVCSALVASLASAQTVARALVTSMEKGIFIFDVDEADAWTENKLLLPTSDDPAVGPYRPTRAVYRDGIVYVADSMSGSDASTTSYIRKYDLKGTYLGVLCEFAGSIDGMVFSPDGRYLFASKFLGEQGGVYRYDFATQEWTGYLTNYMGTQQLAVDDAGHLFVASRYTNTWEGSLDVFEIETMTPIKTWRGKGLPSCWGCAWNPENNLVYVCYTQKNWGIFNAAGERIVASTEADQNIGWCFGVAFVNGKMYYGSKNQHIWRMDESDAETHACSFTSVFEYVSKWSGDGFTVYDISELFVDDATAHWAFEEDAAAAKSAESIAGDRAAIAENGFFTGATGLGGAAYFSAETSRAAMENSQNLIPATGDFTLTVWVNLPAKDSATGVRTILSNAAGRAGDLSVVADVGAANALALSFTSANGSAVSIESAAQVADGTWHQVGVLRSGTALGLFMDGVQVGSAEILETDAIAQDRLWYLGATPAVNGDFIGAGSYLDELKIFERALLSSEIKKFYAQTKPSAAVAPTLPESADPLPTEFGNEVAHALSSVAPFGNPDLLIAADGSWYVVADRKNERNAVGGFADVFKSIDAGATWTSIGTIPAAGVSLFEAGEKIAAIGLKSDGTGRTFAVWTLEEGVWTLATSTTHATGSFAMLSGSVYLRDNQFYKAASYLDPANHCLYAAIVSVTATGGAIGNISIAVNANRRFLQKNKVELNTLADVPGGTITAAVNNNFLQAIYTFVDRKADGSGQQTGVERAGYETVLPSPLTVCATSKIDLFRGGAKPFTVKYDATSKKWWTVTAPVLDSSRLLTTDAERIADRLCVYCSPDLEAWYPCGEILSSETAGFVPGSFAIDNADLVVSYAVATDDGVGGVRSSVEGTYLAWTRIANFRTALVPFAPNSRKFMLICDGEPDTQTSGDSGGVRAVRKYYQTADGEWQPGGVFATDGTSATFDGKSYAMGGPCSPIVKGDSVYILAGRMYPRVFEFSWKGRFRRMIIDPKLNKITPIGMDITADGKSFLMTSVSPGFEGIWKMDIETGAMTKLVAMDSTYLTVPKLVLAAPDGGFYASNYDWKAGKRNCYKYDQDGNFLETTATAPNYMVTLALDPTAQTLYCGDLFGPVFKVDTSTKAKTDISNRNLGSLHSNNVAFLMGDTIFQGSRYGATAAFDVNTGAETAPFATLNSNTGMALVDRKDISLMILLK